MNSCERYELLASLTVDEEATLEERAELAKHLESCPACRAYYGDIQKIHEAFAPEEVVLPENFSTRVMDQVRATRQDPPEEEKKTVRFPRWRRWAALAACCAVAALSVWGMRGMKSARDAGMVSTDRVLRMQQASDAGQAAEGLPEGSGAAADGISVLSDAPPPAPPEEYEELAKSAVKDGPGEGECQPAVDTSPAPAAAGASGDSPTAYDRDAAPPASNESAPVEEDEPADAEPAPPVEEETDQPEEKLETDAAAEPVPEPEAPPENPEDPEDVENLEEERAVEPAEVVNVPDPGILIAYGGAARQWVEDSLGLEWAVGGSYSLSAEQYGDLLRILDEAGEPYRIEPGEGYCLMTE